MSELIKEKQDLTYLKFSKIRNSSGTAGSFLKAYDTVDNRKVYYKLSNYDSLNGIIGHESINELIVDRLLNIFEFDHLHYDLINADVLIDDKNINTYLCRSFDYKNKEESKIALDLFYEFEKEENEKPLDFFIRCGFEKEVYEMIVTDFIVLNRDRHGANIEILVNYKNNSFRLAPMFDHGFSLLSTCLTKKDIESFDVIKDRQIQSFFASKSAYDNLELIPNDSLPIIKKYKDEYKEELLMDLQDIVDDTLLEKIWELISKRWKYYENFCDKKRSQG